VPTEIGTSPESFTQYGNDQDFSASAGSKWNLRQSELGKSRSQTPTRGLYAQPASSSPIFTHFTLLRLSSQIMATSMKCEASPYSVLHHPLNSYILTSKHFPQKTSFSDAMCLHLVYLSEMSCKKQLLALSCPSVRLSACPNERRLSAERVDW